MTNQEINSNKIQIKRTLFRLIIVLLIAWSGYVWYRFNKINEHCKLLIGMGTSAEYIKNDHLVLKMKSEATNHGIIGTIIIISLYPAVVFVAGGSKSKQ